MESSRSQGKNGVANAVVGVGALTPHPRNYNQHSAGQVGDLRRSLRRFGQVRSIVVQAQAEPGRWLIVAGHGIVEAARAEGLDTLRADIIPAGWDDAMVLAYLAADNELARQGQADEAQLAALLRDVAAQADQELAALAAGSEARLTEMLATLDGGAAGDAEPQVDRAAELNEKWQVRPGDLWRIGEHRLACGDCTDRAVVERVMAGEKADMVCTDPPYAIYGSSTGIGGDVTDDNMVRPFMRITLAGFCQITNLGAHIYTFCDWRSYAAWWDEARKQNLIVRNCIVWDKGDGGLGANYTMRHEFVVFYEHLPKSVTMTEAARSRNARTVNGRANVQRLNVPQNGERFHNAAKPVKLLEVFIDASSDIGDIVYDPFLGSGTTLVACQNLGRRGRGIEISPEYCAVVLQRMSDAFPGIEIERLTPRAGMGVDDENGAK